MGLNQSPVLVLIVKQISNNITVYVHVYKTKTNKQTNKQKTPLLYKTKEYINKYTNKQKTITAVITPAFWALFVLGLD